MFNCTFQPDSKIALQFRNLKIGETTMETRAIKLLFLDSSNDYKVIPIDTHGLPSGLYFSVQMIEIIEKKVGKAFCKFLDGYEYGRVILLDKKRRKQLKKLKKKIPPGNKFFQKLLRALVECAEKQLEIYGQNVVLEIRSA